MQVDSVNMQTTMAIKRHVIKCSAQAPLCFHGDLLGFCFIDSFCMKRDLNEIIPRVGLFKRGLGCAAILLLNER